MEDGRKTGKRALKNLFSLSGAFLLSSAVGFAATAFIARRLTSIGYGRIAFAQALLAYFSLIGDLGLNRFGTREIARTREKVRDIVNGVVTLQLSFSLLATLMMVLFCLLISRPREDKVILALYSLYIILASLSLDWAFKGREKMGMVAVSQIMASVTYAVLIFLFLRGQEDIFLVPIFYLVSVALRVVFLAAAHLRRFGLVRLVFDMDFFRSALKVGIPFFFSIVMIQVYYNLDTVMLGFMKGDRIVGLYNAAYRIIMVLIGIGSLLAETFFPLFSRFFRESPEKLETILDVSVKVYCTLAFPLAVGGIILARPLIVLIFGAGYEGSTAPFRILILTVAVIYVSFTFGFTNMACDRERRYMVGVGIGALVNILLNAVLIPSFDMRGAAVATLASEVVVLIYMLLSAREVVKINLWRHLARPAVASGVMAAAIAWSDLHVLANIAIGAAVYLLAFLVMKGVTDRDVSMFRQYVLGRE